MHRNESYSICQLTNQLHSVATPTTINSTGPYDDIILVPERVEVMDHNQQNTNAQVETATSTLMGDETGEGKNITEEHTYEIVASEDREGRRGRNHQIMRWQYQEKLHGE